MADDPERALRSDLTLLQERQLWPSLLWMIDPADRDTGFNTIVEHYKRLHVRSISEQLRALTGRARRWSATEASAVAHEIHEAAKAEFSQLVQKGELAKLYEATKATEALPDFGRHLCAITEQQLDRHPAFIGQSAWRVCWEASPRRFPFGQGSFFTWEEILRNAAMHYFTREFFAQGIDQIPDQIPDQIADDLPQPGCISQIVVYEAMEASRQLIRNLMQTTYRQPRSVAQIDAIDRLPHFRRARATLKLFYNVTGAKVLVVCPPQPNDERGLTGERKTDNVKVLAWQGQD